MWRAQLDEAQAHLSVYTKETQQRLHNVQREREAHEAFMREYEAHFSECKDEATARETGIVQDQEAKLTMRRSLAETKAMEAAWSRNSSLPAGSGLQAAR